MDRLSELAHQLVQRLEKHQICIVLAESCTGGLVAATLTRVPGVSQWLCGSAVTYQGETKTAWLEIPESDLRQFSAVSESVTITMAQKVLDKTPQASYAVAVTGHFGPDAPPSDDGLVFLAAARRSASGPEVTTRQLRLASSERVERQVEATEAVLRFAIDELQRMATG